MMNPAVKSLLTSKTFLCLVGLVVVLVLHAFGVIPDDMADQLVTFLGAGAGVAATWAVKKAHTDVKQLNDKIDVVTKQQ